MNYKTIANMPTSLLKDELDMRSSGWHESCLRSYHILAKVKWLLEKNTASDVVLELIRLMESNDFQPYAWHVEQAGKQTSTLGVERHHHEEKP